jgi:hypothetical protein
MDQASPRIYSIRFTLSIKKNDDPEQFRATGWCRGRLCSVIFEIRHDSEGEYYHLVTAWKSTEQEEQSYAENA